MPLKKHCKDAGARRPRNVATLQREFVRQLPEPLTAVFYGLHVQALLCLVHDPLGDAHVLGFVHQRLLRVSSIGETVENQLLGYVRLFLPTDAGEQVVDADVIVAEPLEAIVCAQLKGNGLAFRSE